VNQPQKFNKVTVLQYRKETGKDIRTCFENVRELNKLGEELNESTEHLATPPPRFELPRTIPANQWTTRAGVTTPSVKRTLRVNVNRYGALPVPVKQLCSKRSHHRVRPVLQRVPMLGAMHNTWIQPSTVRDKRVNQLIHRR